MKLSYDAIWQDVTHMMRAHAELIFIIAGAFLFLPMLAQALYLPPPSVKGFDQAALAELMAYFRGNIGPLFLLRAVMLVGTGTLLALLLSPERPTVGEAIKRGVALMPTLLLVDILSQFLTLGGAVLFLLPGLYLFARTYLGSAAAMAERIGNPLRAIGRSFALTHSHGWQVFGLLAIVIIVSWIAVSAASTVIGIITEILLPDEAAELAAMILASLSQMILTLVMTLLAAGLYRHISAAKASS